MSWEASLARINEMVALDAATPGGLKPEDIADETREYAQSPEHFREMARSVDSQGTAQSLADDMRLIADELEQHGRAERYSMSDGRLYRTIYRLPTCEAWGWHRWMRRSVACW
jgi:hypothetical protein